MEIGVSKADCYLIGQRREIQVALFRTRQTPETLDVIECNLDSEEELRSAAEASLQRRKKLDVLVNNAGIMPEAGNESILNIDLDLLWQAFNTNVLGTARSSERFIHCLLKASVRAS